MSLYDRIRKSRTLPLVESIQRSKYRSALLRAIFEDEDQQGGFPHDKPKVLHFMVGPPGAGKSTQVRKHVERGARAHSSDNFPGLYGPPEKPGGAPSIDFKKLPDAHAWNQKNAEDDMARGHPHVIVDNTNTAAWQTRPYLKAAAKHGYHVHFTHLNVPTEEARARGKHFPRERPAEGEPDRLDQMKKGADEFAGHLHALKHHPAPMKELDKRGHFHMPWEGDGEGQVPRGDHSDLHGLKHTIETIDTSSKKRS